MRFTGIRNTATKNTGHDPRAQVAPSARRGAGRRCWASSPRSRAASSPRSRVPPARRRSGHESLVCVFEAIVFNVIFHLHSTRQMRVSRFSTRLALLKKNLTIIGKKGEKRSELKKKREKKEKSETERAKRRRNVVFAF